MAGGRASPDGRGHGHQETGRGRRRGRGAFLKPEPSAGPAPLLTGTFACPRTGQPPGMNPVEKAIRKVDAGQQRFTPTAFVFGVIKKYGDDNGGVLASNLA